MDTRQVYLSPEGVEEIIREMQQPPKDTPERRATFELARSTRPLVDQVVFPPFSPVALSFARAALAALYRRANEDIDEWARRISEDIRGGN